MSRKTAYLEKMGETLKHLDKKIAKYSREAEEMAGEASTTGRQELEELTRRRDAFGAKLEEARRRTGEAWDEMQKGLDRARVELDDALSSTKRALRN